MQDYKYFWYLFIDEMEKLKYFWFAFILGSLYLIGGIKKWYVLLRILWLNYPKVSPKTIRYGSIALGIVLILAAIEELIRISSI